MGKRRKKKKKVRKLLAFIYYESIKAAILDCEVSTNGIIGNF